jgi:hypothetical protein
VIYLRVPKLSLVFAVVLAFDIAASAAAADTLPVAAPATPSAGTSTPDKAIDGKYYLIWQVAAQKVEAGAEVAIEPLLLTNGDRFVFAYDFCRQEHMKTPASRGHWRPMGYAPDVTIDPNTVAKDDLVFLKKYCAYKPVVFSAETIWVRNEFGIELKLDSIVFPAPPVESWQTERIVAPYLPGSGTAKILGVESGVSGSSPLAIARSPMGFLMSRQKALLQSLAPFTGASDTVPPQVLKDFEKFQGKFVLGQPLPKELLICGSLSPKGTPHYDWVRPDTSVPKEKTQTVSRWVADVDDDGKPDLLIREHEFFELKNNTLQKERLDTIRVFLSDGGEFCKLITASPVRNYIVQLVQINNCWSVLLSGPTGLNQAFSISALSAKSPRACPERWSIKYYENTH